MMHMKLSVLFAMFMPAVALAAPAVLENPLVRYEVTETGRSLSLINKSTGDNLLGVRPRTYVLAGVILHNFR
jgi:hypothetical protein